MTDILIYFLKYPPPESLLSGLLVRQAEIESLTARCKGLASAHATARAAVDGREQALSLAQATLVAARPVRRQDADRGTAVRSDKDQSAPHG